MMMVMLLKEREAFWLRGSEVNDINWKYGVNNVLCGTEGDVSVFKLSK